VRAAERLACAAPFGACAAEWVEPGAPAVAVFAAVVAAGAWRGAFALGALCIGGVVVVAPLAVPNHWVVAGWLALLLALREGRDPAAARALYGVVMALATVQKLLSPHFIDGSFIGLLGLTGGLLRPLWAFEAWARLFDANAALIAEAPLGHPVTLRGPQTTWAWSLMVSWGILAIEGALAGMAVRGGRVFLALAASFVVALPVVRDEPVFASVLAALTALCAPTGRWRFGLLAVSVGWAVLALSGLVRV
jgi:hypothetical protein